MKKFLLILGLTSLIAVNSLADVLSTNITSAATKLLLTNYVKINQLVFVNAGTQSVTLALFDNNVATVTTSNNSYTAYTLTSSYITNIYTNVTVAAPSGTYKTVTNIYPILSNVVTTVSAATNDLSPMLFMLVPTNNSVIYQPNTPMTYTRGLVLTNSDTISVTATYDRMF